MSPLQTMRLAAVSIVVAAGFFGAHAQREDPQRTVVMRLEPQNVQHASFLRPVDPPHPIGNQQSAATPTVMSPAQPPRQVPASAVPFVPRPEVVRQIPSVPAAAFAVTPAPSAPGTESPAQRPVHAQQPVLAPASQANGVGQQFDRRELAVPPQAPPVNIPPDVQNQLIKFFGLDSFGIPGLTGSHPNGFAGAVQELRTSCCGGWN